MGENRLHFFTVTDMLLVIFLFRTICDHLGDSRHYQHIDVVDFLPILHIDPSLEKQAAAAVYISPQTRRNCRVSLWNF